MVIKKVTNIICSSSLCLLYFVQCHFFQEMSPDPPHVGYASSSTPKAASLKVLISCIQIFFLGGGEGGFHLCVFVSKSGIWSISRAYANRCS